MENPDSVWVMQYFYNSNPDELLVWGDWFSSPEEGEKMVKEMNAWKMASGEDTFQVAWYKNVKRYQANELFSS